jgi:UDP-N-acetylmuramate--alanine ligase
MEADFARSLEGADRVVVLEVYPAGEPDPGGLSAASLAARVPGAAFAPDAAAARRALEEVVEEGDLVLLMGAGPDPRRLGDELARQG